MLVTLLDFEGTMDRLTEIEPVTVLEELIDRVSVNLVVPVLDDD